MRDQGQPARLSRKYGRGQALWFGLPLGALTLGILLLAVKFPARLSPGAAILIGLSLCIIIPLSAGYRYCYQQRHEGWESGWAGFRLGLVAATLFMLVMTMWMIIAIHIQESTPPPPNSRVFHSQTLDVIVGAIVFGVFAALNGAGMLLSAVGARIGGALAIWRAKSQTPVGKYRKRRSSGNSEEAVRHAREWTARTTRTTPMAAGVGIWSTAGIARTRRPCPLLHQL